MATSPSAHSTLVSSLLKQHKCSIHIFLHCSATNERKATKHHNKHLRFVCCAISPEPPRKDPPGEDTRIHWENEEDGWVGGSSSNTQFNDEESFLGNKFSELLNNSDDSHYQFLGISAEADTEEIKAAYRKLSKEYHPDTTSLPIKAASEKFMKLKQVYDVLSDVEKRKFYDWTLAQEIASREAEKMRRKFEDPHLREVLNWEPIPDMVDQLGGKNMELGNQAKSALFFDIFAILFSIGCIIYAMFFKEQ